MEWLSGSLDKITSAVPSIPTATTCRSIQLQNHRRPSCHRGDSGIPRPLSSTVGSAMTPSSLHWAAPGGGPPPPTRTTFGPIDTGQAANPPSQAGYQAGAPAASSADLARPELLIWPTGCAQP